VTGQRADEEASSYNSDLIDYTLLNKFMIVNIRVCRQLID